MEGIPDADLFFVDKVITFRHLDINSRWWRQRCTHKLSILPLSILQAPDEGVATSIKQGILPKKLQHRQRLTRAQAILQAAHNAKPVSKPQPRKKRPEEEKKLQEKAARMLHGRAKGNQKPSNDDAAKDLWGEDEIVPADPNIKRRQKIIVTHPSLASGQPLAKRQKHSKLPALPPVPAVAVDHPGCSFNPDRELHQDAVAEAVAAELKRQQQRELQPTAPLKIFLNGAVDEDELAMLQVEEEADDDDDVQEDNESEEEDYATAKGSRKLKIKTQKDRNREARARANTAEVERARRDKRQRRDLEELPLLKSNVEQELAEREERRARKQADLEEKRANEPPRLGKHKFEPMKLQVLTTDEITGSLRQLKPTPTLTTERFKSLQRRGIIEPRHKIANRVGKKRTVVRGERHDRAEESQRELEDLRKASKEARKGAAKKNKN